MLKRWTKLLAVIVLGGVALRCGSGDGVTSKDGAEKVFQEARLAYEDEDYLEARRLFNVIRLQFPATEWADDAQYYLAEINMEREEYILAAYNYSSLYRSFPKSNYLKEAYYKEAMCYYNLSPEYFRDQSYTKDAIQRFTEFQAFFAGDSLAAEADRRILELRDKLALRDFETAQLYVNMSALRSALIYFDAVIDNYPDTQYVEAAYHGKIHNLMRLERLDEAREAIRLYHRRFSNGEYLDEIREFESELAARR